MQFHTRPLKKVVFCGCQANSAILRNNHFCVRQNIQEMIKEQQEDGQINDHFEIFIFVEETSWRG